MLTFDFWNRVILLDDLVNGFLRIAIPENELRISFLEEIISEMKLAGKNGKILIYVMKKLWSQ